MTAHQGIGEQLKGLRQKGFPGHRVRQSDLAEALGVGAPAVSGWETGSLSVTDSRIDDYARFFATARSLTDDGPRLLADDEMTEAERNTMTTIATELRESVRISVEAPTRPSAPDLWAFPDGRPIYILCGSIATESKYADTKDHNFMRIAGLADADAVFELYGHLCRVNPTSEVAVISSEENLGRRQQVGHLVVLGNLGQLQGRGKLIPEAAFPVAQVGSGVRGADGEIFEVTEGERQGERIGPEFEQPNEWSSQVVQDVGLIARMPNPNFSDATLTLCSGVFTRGVLGAVRTLTDPALGPRNTLHLTERFGGKRLWLMLVRVRISHDQAMAPDLGDANNVVFEHSTDS